MSVLVSKRGGVRKVSVALVFFHSLLGGGERGGKEGEEQLQGRWIPFKKGAVFGLVAHTSPNDWTAGKEGGRGMGTGGKNRNVAIT